MSGLTIRGMHACLAPAVDLASDCLGPSGCRLKPSRRCAADSTIADTITADTPSLMHALLQQCHGLYDIDGNLRQR